MTPEELEEKVYDRFDIELKQLQILMVKPGRCPITLKYLLTIRVMVKTIHPV